MPTATIELAAGPSSVAIARHFVTDRLLEWRAERMLDPTVLLVSELVTNAVLHGLPPVHCSVTLDRDGVRVEVSDSSPVSPSLREVRRRATNGRGLRLVEMLASAWGCDAIPGDGKSVWFDIVPAPDRRLASR